MPRARVARTTAAQVVVLPEHPGGTVTDQEEPAELVRGLPLFSGSEGITSISVYRMEPIHEGNLGSLPPEADEETIRRRYGGGQFKVVAKTASGQYAASKIITISGDPLFESVEAKRRYKIKMAGLDADDDRPAPPAPAAPPLAGLGEVIALIRAGHEQQLQMMRMQIEAQRADNLAREDRQRRESEDSRARDREYTATLMQIMRRDDKSAAGSGAEMVTMMLRGLQLGRELTQDREDAQGGVDPTTILLKNLPGILEHGGRLLTGAPQAAPPPATPAGPPVAEKGKFLRLSGAVAEKLRAEIQRLMALGYSEPDAMQIAEAALGRGVDLLAQVPAPPPAPPAQAAAAPAAAPPPEAPPATPAGPPAEPAAKPAAPKGSNGGSRHAAAPRATPAR